MAKNGLLDRNSSYEEASPYNLGGTRRAAPAPSNDPSPSNDPYQSGLQTNFTDQLHGGYQAGEVNGHWGMEGSNADNGNNSPDQDVRTAQRITNMFGNKDEGMDLGAMASQLNLARARIGQKNALGEAIASNPNQEMLAEQNVKQEAGQALDSGINNTRDNYNSRGLLYSGMREGGEASVRNAVAGQMASGIAGTRQDYQTAQDAQKQAYASVDLANQQDTLNRATQAFDTANQNNIARMQAMQQLGGGLGSAAGTIAGGKYYDTTSPSPTSGGGYGQSAQDVQNWMANPMTGTQTSQTQGLL
jgi:hypothetical protein